MEWLKFMPLNMLYGVLSMLLIKFGNSFKNKDDNATGNDDAFGNVLIALAPAVAAMEDNNKPALVKALTVVRDTIDGYLKQKPTT